MDTTTQVMIPPAAATVTSAEPPSLVRDRSRDGLRNTLTFLILTSGGWFWRLIQSIPSLERLANWGIVNLAIKYAPFRPNPLSTASDYSSWASLTDRRFFGRHLPPLDAPRPQPNQDKLAAIFARPEPGRASHKSTVLFGYFAQWFTDGFMRSDFTNVDRKRMTNSSNHEIDLCNLYGLKPAETEVLRAHEGGKLKSQFLGGEEYPPFLYKGNDIDPQFAALPPLFAGRKMEFRPGQKEHLFAMGTDRGNVTTGYAMMNVLFLREHNRIAARLADLHHDWDDERLFQTTRNIMIVLLLKIVVEDYVNHITPYHFKLRLVTGRRIKKEWYRPNWVALEFNLLYRWHSLTPNLVRFGETTVPVRDTQINNALLIQHGLAAAFAGAASQRAGEIGLFNTPDFLARQTDLPSIVTARNASLRTYNDYREWCKFPRVTDVRQISSRPEVQDALRECYPGGVDDIELYPGLFAEDIRPNSLLGPLMGRMVGIDALSQALTNPLLTPTLYNKDTFSEEGLRIIDTTASLSDIVMRNVTRATPVSFTYRGFTRSRGWNPPAPIPLEALPISERTLPATETHTVNDTIVKAFTMKVDAEFAAQKSAGRQQPTMRRGAHPKHHGVVRARFEVLDGLKPPFSVGLFSAPGSYDAYVRFSNSGRGDDGEPDAHGMAIKLLGVPGRGLLDDERSTRDFMLVDAPVFIARSPEDFAEFLVLSAKAAAATTKEEQDRLAGGIARRFPNVKMLRKLIPSPLTVPYWSQVPYSFGDQMVVKYKCEPVALDLGNFDPLKPGAVAPGKDSLREAMRARLRGREPVVFHFKVQLRKGDMPIDDPTIPWLETESVPVHVATLTILPQEFESPAQMAFAENMSFNPWHTAAEHRPLGRVNEARREVYTRMQAQRHEANRVVPREPTGVHDF